MKLNTKKVIFIILGVIFAILLVLIVIDSIAIYENRDNYSGNIKCSLQNIPILRRICGDTSDIIVKKPALYFYPVQTEEINVKLNFEGNIFKYPAYDNDLGWNIVAKPTGELNVGDRSYDYLFWEGKTEASLNFDLTKGFIVKKENVVNFLEENLSKFGLNDKEKSEFIIYWAPIMQGNENTLVHFATKGEYDDILPIEISPKPDNFNRLFMVIKSVSSKYRVTEQSITKFDRSGYNVLEWGGANLDEK
ncbi:hypothetical protein IPJ91_03510 [bacterium]|nr:MAG: hypothetical protein IPJ91_03510 [bacterium]